MKTRIRVINVVALTSAAFIWMTACGDNSGQSMASTPTVSPAKAFALMDPGDDATAMDTFLALSTVDGIAVRTSWQTLAPSQGVYDWGVIDTAVNAAMARNKKLTLHVTASVYGAPPSWVYAEGAQSYSYTATDGSLKTDPLPWDNVFLGEWSTFVNALASHLSSINAGPYIQYVSVAVPVAEMSLVACANGRLGREGYSYSSLTYQGAWQTSIQAMQTALPDVAKPLSAPVTHICRFDYAGTSFYHDLLNYALGLGANGFVIYATDLNAVGSQRLNVVWNDATRAPVAFQFVGPSSDARMQGSLKSAVCSGLKTYRAAYFEVYKQDLQSTQTTIQDAIQAIHSPERCG